MDKQKPMVESQTRLGKPSWASEAHNPDARAEEQAIDFKFFITWFSLFTPMGASTKPGDAVVPLNHRVPTLVTSLRDPTVQREERDSMGRVRAEEENSAAGTSSSRRASGLSETSSTEAQSLEKHPSSDRPDMDPNFKVAWEMVVPRMVRSTPKALPAEFKPPIFQSEHKKNFPVQLQRLGIGLAITLIGILALLFLHRGMSTPKKIAPAQVASPALRFEVEPEQNGLLNLRWNSASAAVARAREGRLIIVERDQQPKTLALNAEQLKTGHLSFQPLGDRVVFRLEVVDGSGALVKESVLAQSSSVPVAASTEVPAQTVPAAKAAAGAKAEPKADLSEVAKTPVSQPARPAREFTPPPSSQRSNLDGRGPLPDPPAAEIGASPVAPMRILDPGERAGLNRIAPPPAKASPAPVKVGGNLQAGKLIKKVSPLYPFMAEAARVQGSVRFTAIIAKDGTIQNLQLVSGPSLLVKAATDAVKQWVYQPTVLNGEPVEVQTQIEVNFNLTR